MRRTRARRLSAVAAACAEVVQMYERWGMQAMRLTDMPLFPLGSLLVPNMELPLRIFEARYREMIGKCLTGDRRFGVVLIREGLEVGETASPYEVGTVAEIVQAARSEDGQIFIVTEGRERFRIVERFYDREYLHGTVEFLDESLGLSENASPLADEGRDLALQYIGILLRLGDEEDGVEITLPADPLELSYKIVHLLQVPDIERQQLLEAGSAEERLRLEVQILRREVMILERMASISTQDDSFFSAN